MRPPTPATPLTCPPQHGPDASVRRPGAPDELMCVAENILPKMILRLLQHLRERSIHAGAATPEELLDS